MIGTAKKQSLAGQLGEGEPFLMANHIGRNTSPHFSQASKKEYLTLVGYIWTYQKPVSYVKIEQENVFIAIFAQTQSHAIWHIKNI